MILGSCMRVSTVSFSCRVYHFLSIDLGFMMILIFSMVSMIDNKHKDIAKIMKMLPF